MRNWPLFCSLVPALGALSLTAACPTTNDANTCVEQTDCLSGYACEDGTCIEDGTEPDASPAPADAGGEPDTPVDAGGEPDAPADAGGEPDAPADAGPVVVDAGTDVDAGSEGDGGTEPEPDAGPATEPPDVTACMADQRLLLGSSSSPIFEVFERSTFGWRMEKAAEAGEAPGQGVQHLFVEGGDIWVGTGFGVQRADATTLAQVDARGDTLNLSADANGFSRGYVVEMEGYVMYAGAGAVVFHPTDTTSSGTIESAGTTQFYGMTDIVDVNGDDTVFLSTNEGIAVYQAGTTAVQTLPIEGGETGAFNGRRGIAYDASRGQVWVAGQGSLWRATPNGGSAQATEFDYAGEVVGLNDAMASEIFIVGDEVHAFFDGDDGGHWLTVAHDGTLLSSRRWTEDSFSNATPTGGAVMCGRYVALATAGNLFANPDIRIIDLVTETAVAVTSSVQGWPGDVVAVHRSVLGL